MKRKVGLTKLMNSHIQNKLFYCPVNKALKSWKLGKVKDKRFSFPYSIYMTSLDQEKKFTKIYGELRSQQGQIQDDRHYPGCHDKK